MSIGACDSVSEASGHVVQCEREFAHGGAHTATLDIDGDPYVYRLSWWPTQQKYVEVEA